MGVGRWILQHGQVPRLDPFSFTAAHRPYVDSHWLFQALLYGLFRLGSLPLMAMFQAGCFLAAAWLVARSVQRPRPPEALWGLLLIMVPAISDRILMRPDMVTLLFLGLFWHSLYSDAPRSRPWRWSLPFAQALWTNMHGLYPFGAMMTGAAVAAILACRFLPLPAALKEREDRGISWKEAAALGAAVFLACLLTPYGLEGIRYSLLLYQEIGSGADSFMKGVSELKSTGAVYQLGPAVIAYRMVLIAALASAALNWRKMRLSSLFVFLAFLHLAEKSIRNTAYFAMIAVPFAAQNLAAWWGERHLPRAAPLIGRGLTVCAAVSLAWFVATDRYYLLTKDNKRFGLAWNPFLAVRGATGFVERNGLSGPYLNDILFGGYLIWKWHPARPVFVDGRLEVYGRRFLEEYKRLGEAPAAAWDQMTGRYGIEFAILSGISPYSERIVEHLAGRKDWPLIYCDGFTAVYARKDGKNREAVAKVLKTRAELFAPPPEPEPGPRWLASWGGDFPLLELARAKFALLYGKLDIAREEYLKALEAAPGLPDALASLGALEYRAGHLGESARLLEQALKVQSQPQVLASLGAVYLTQGRIQDALPLLEKAVRLQPDLGSAHASLGTGYYLSEDYPKAAESYQRALSFLPNDAMTRHNLGACYLQLGRQEEAAAEFKRALELKPDYAQARQALSSLKRAGP